MFNKIFIHLSIMLIFGAILVIVALMLIITSRCGVGFFFASKFILIILIIFIGMLLILIFSVKQSYPLSRISREISNIDETNLSTRFKEPIINNEVGNLRLSVNNLLDRLEKSFLKQQNFSLNVVHEIKTPLTIMYTTLQVLDMDDSLTVEDYEEAVLTLKENNLYLNKIVEELFLLSTDKLLSMNETIDLKCLCLQVIGELQPFAQKGSIEMENNLEFVEITGNEILLYRGIYNIVENALKYNKKFGSVKIVLKNNSKHVALEVEDTGIGIPRNAFNDIFEPFYQIENSSSSDIEGSGLGLSIVKMIVEKHRGHIKVHSIENKKTKFIVYLPKDIDC